MGEHKRKQDIRRMVNEFTEKGKLIEAGFVAMLAIEYPDGGLAPERIAVLRDAFFAGAQHLFGSLTASVLDEDHEPTEADLRRMDRIDSELRGFFIDYMRRRGRAPPEGKRQ
jgi:hypothetical protein